MQRLKLENDTKALIVVAHPDDETIWMGEVILSNPKISWTIFSLCRKNDPDRAPKFYKVCKFYGAKGLMSDLDDEAKLTLIQSLPEIECRLSPFVGKEKYDYIFTHGANGEYGHPRHKGVNQIVKKLVQKKKLICSNLFYFAYKTIDKKIVNNFEKADFYFKGETKIFKFKQKLIEKFYGFSQDSFEYQSSKKTETFLKAKI